MILVLTGATGFVGRALIPKLLAKGGEVIILARDLDKAKTLLPKEVTIVKGDILLPECGVKEQIPGVSALYHLAAIHRLGENQAEEIWETNVRGTANVIEFCKKYEVPHLFFISSAYTQGRNPYERSKAICEWMVSNSGIPSVTIFKPSIILGAPQHFYPGHFSQFISLIIKLHQRGEIIRHKIEGSLRLPVLEPVFRLRANPAAKLNLVSIDDVSRAMVEIRESGTFWLTHPVPPTINQLVEWVSEFIMVRIKLEPLFKPTPIEAMFQKMAKAFEPYLWGDDFPSDIKEASLITKEFIQDTIKRTLLA